MVEGKQISVRSIIFLTHEIQISMLIKKILSEHCKFIQYYLWLLLHNNGSCVVAIQTISPAKPKHICIFTEKYAKLLKLNYQPFHRQKFPTADTMHSRNTKWRLVKYTRINDINNCSISKTTPLMSILN